MQQKLADTGLITKSPHPKSALKVKEDFSFEIIETIASCGHPTGHMYILFAHNLPGIYVNYSFSMFLGIELFNVVMSLEAELHCWETACIPRFHWSGAV